MAAEQKRLKLLFLCTGNSARNIVAEYLTKKIGPARGRRARLVTG